MEYTVINLWNIFLHFGFFLIRLLISQLVILVDFVFLIETSMFFYVTHHLLKYITIFQTFARTTKMQNGKIKGKNADLYGSMFLRAFGSSLSAFNFGSCPIKHVTYLKLRRKQILLQAEQMHKMTFISLKMVEVIILSEKKLSSCQLLSL